MNAREKLKFIMYLQKFTIIIIEKKDFSSRVLNKIRKKEKVFFSVVSAIFDNNFFKLMMIMMNMKQVFVNLISFFLSHIFFYYNVFLNCVIYKKKEF